MDFPLDVRTIFISLGIGNLITIILVAAYWHNHAKDVTVKSFFFSKCMQTIAWICQAYRGEIPDILSISVSNSLLFVGAAFEIIALLSLHSSLRPRTVKVYGVLTVLSIIGFQLLIFFYNKEHIRIAYTSLLTSAFMIPVYRLVLGRTTLLMKIVGYLYLFVIAVSFVRVGAALVSIQMMRLFTADIYQTLTFLSLYLVMLLGNTGFVLLLKERADQELIRMASYDDLTGTLNRRTFQARASQQLTDCRKKRRPVSYMLFDIDQFKSINDTYGHSVGDQVLQDLTSRMKDNLDEDALLVRYGGDEFGILLPDKDESVSNDIAARIYHSLEDANQRGLPVVYTVSMGILTVVPSALTKLDTLYTSCDQALYHAKNNGRNGLSRIQIDETG